MLVLRTLPWRWAYHIYYPIFKYYHILEITQPSAFFPWTHLVGTEHVLVGLVGALVVRQTLLLEDLERETIDSH